MATFDRPPTAAFPRAEIVEIDLSPHGFERLCSFVMHAYARDEDGRPTPLGPGLYGDSRFYLGRESYFLTTCNVWTARALRSAGLPISPAYAVTARNVMFQVRKLGKPVGPGGVRGRPRPGADDQQEHVRHHDLAHQRREEGMLAGRVVAIAVGGQAALDEVEPRLPGGDDGEDGRGGNGAATGAMM